MLPCTQLICIWTLTSHMIPLAMTDLWAQKLEQYWVWPPNQRDSGLEVWGFGTIYPGCDYRHYSAIWLVKELQKKCFEVQNCLCYHKNICPCKLFPKVDKPSAEKQGACSILYFHNGLPNAKWNKKKKNICSSRRWGEILLLQKHTFYSYLYLRTMITNMLIVEVQS